MSSSLPSIETPPPSLSLRRPDDWHVHLRDGAMLRAVAPFTARSFARAIVMPNLVPPVITAAAAGAYRERILGALPPETPFVPLMTAYLSDATDPSDLAAGFRDGVFTACKLYPAHATTNSAAGVSDLNRLGPVFATLEAIGMPLLVHGEVQRRHLRSRSGVSGAAPGAAGPASSRPEGGAGAHHHRAGGRLR
jgi:dihydroorotase